MQNGALVIEDCPTDRELIEVELRKHAIPFLSVLSVQEAKRRIESEDYGAILLNLNLSKWGSDDGLAMAFWCTDHYPHIPLVIVTGEASKHDLDRLAATGAVVLCRKPYHTAQWLKNALRARNAAFEKGRLMKNWRTTLGGSLQTLGTTIMGYGVVTGSTDMAQAEKLKPILIAGFILHALGGFFASLFAADKQPPQPQEPTTKP